MRTFACLSYLRTGFAGCSIFVLSILFISSFGESSFGQDWAKARLESSPRHQEWVTVEHDGRKIECFVMYPEVAEKATPVLVIHEIFGLSEWIQSVCDQLAEAGYIAIAPDLLSGAGPDGGGTRSMSGRDEWVRAISSLPPDQITSDLNAVAKYALSIPAAKDKLVVAGFCWGGSQTFRFATNTDLAAAACAFYGAGPDDLESIKRIQIPVYGFYGENDSRVNATIETSKALMAEAGKTYEPVIYSQAGHGFMRAGEDPEGNEANKKARVDAWERLKKIIDSVHG